MSGIFISYRRADTQGWAGRLGEDLAQAFGDVARFFDLASIPPGADFIVEIERAIGEADAALVLIGPRWLDLRDEDGTRRLDDPNDLVAAEVSLALARPMVVIPVLLGGMTMPRAKVLPEKLRPLARRNAFELSDSRWGHDLDRLLAALEGSTRLKRRPAATVTPASPISMTVQTALLSAGERTEFASHQITARVMAPDGPLPKIDRVVYLLPPSFGVPAIARSTSEDGFALTMAGAGSFLLQAKVYFADGTVRDLSRQIDLRAP